MTTLVHHQSYDVIGALLTESQLQLMIDDVHHPPNMIFQTLINDFRDAFKKTS